MTVAGEGAVEPALADGTLLAPTDVAPTGGPCAYRTLGAEPHLRDVTDLRVRLHGPVRLARTGFAG